MQMKALVSRPARVFAIGETRPRACGRVVRVAGLLLQAQWHAVEEQNNDAFGRMHIIYCQRPL